MASAGELLGAAVKALARCDAAELERLAAEAEAAAAPATSEDREAALAGLRALGHLLRLTRQNLRILRGVCGAPCGYGTGRS